MEHLRRVSRPALLVAALFVLGPRGAWAAPGTGTPSPEPPGADPHPLVARLRASPEPLPLELFAEAALVFSGTSVERLPRARAELMRLVEEAGQAAAAHSDPRERAEALLGFLHEQALERYDERQTRVDVLLEEGSFNCVSSGVLYALAAKALGFRVWGVRTEDHAFCRIQAGERAFDVETTSPFGFDPGTRKEFTDSFGKVTGYTYVPPSSYRQREDIGERGLLGLILYNRTAALSDRKSYHEAVAPAVDAYSLLADAESHQRMIVSFLNLGSWYGLNREFSTGMDFLDRMAARHPEPRLSALREDLLHNWVLSLVEKREFEAAEAVLDGQHGGGRLAETEWKSLTVYLYQMKAQEAARTNFAVAARLIEEGLSKTGADGALQRSFEVYVHNEAVSLIRTERLQEALAVLDRGLQVAPESALLRKDHSLVTTRLENP